MHLLRHVAFSRRLCVSSNSLSKLMSGCFYVHQIGPWMHRALSVVLSVTSVEKQRGPGSFKAGGWHFRAFRLQSAICFCSSSLRTVISFFSPKGLQLSWEQRRTWGLFPFKGAHYYYHYYHYFQRIYSAIMHHLRHVTPQRHSSLAVIGSESIGDPIEPPGECLQVEGGAVKSTLSAHFHSPLFLLSLSSNPRMQVLSIIHVQVQLSLEQGLKEKKKKKRDRCSTSVSVCVIVDHFCPPVLRVMQIVLFPVVPA